GRDAVAAVYLRWQRRPVAVVAASSLTVHRQRAARGEVAANTTAQVGRRLVAGRARAKVARLVVVASKRHGVRAEAGARPIALASAIVRVGALAATANVVGAAVAVIGAGLGIVRVGALAGVADVVGANVA